MGCHMRHDGKVCQGWSVNKELFVNNVVDHKTSHSADATEAVVQSKHASHGSWYSTGVRAIVSECVGPLH